VGRFFVAKYEDGKKMNVYKSMGLKQVTSEQEPHVQKDPNGEQR
jgi:hypothetical protein